MQENTLTKEQLEILINLKDDLEKTGNIIADDINDIIVDYSEIDK